MVKLYCLTTQQPVIAFGDFMLLNIIGMQTHTDVTMCCVSLCEHVHRCVMCVWWGWRGGD